MITALIWIVVGVIAKTLLPFPSFDDRVRAAWSWAYDKVMSWLR